MPRYAAAVCRQQAWGSGDAAESGVQTERNGPVQTIFHPGRTLEPEVDTTVAARQPQRFQFGSLRDLTGDERPSEGRLAPEDLIYRRQHAGRQRRIGSHAQRRGSLWILRMNRHIGAESENNVWP